MCVCVVVLVGGGGGFIFIIPFGGVRCRYMWVFFDLGPFEALVSFRLCFLCRTPMFFPNLSIFVGDVCVCVWGGLLNLDFLLIQESSGFGTCVCGCEWGEAN